MRTALLTRDPLPEVKDAYITVSREESHRGVPTTSVKSEKAQISAFVSKTPDNRTGNWKKKLITLGIIILVTTGEIMTVCYVLIVV